MPLLERCKKLREKIERHDGLRRAHNDAEAFRDRANDVRVLRETLASALGKVKVLRAKGVAIVKIPDPASAIATLEDYRQRLSDGSSEGGKDFGRLKRSIEKVGGDVTASVQKALDLVKRDLPTIEEAFLKQVELIPAYASQVGRIRQQRDSLLNGAEPSAMPADELGRFLDRRDELRKLADGLDPEEFPKEVLDFFKSARHGGAPLEKLTDTVRKWLSERDQLKNIRLTIIAR